MGMPTRFSIDFPGRCLQLIDSFEETARKQDLLGSFSLLAAASVLSVPFERSVADHFLHRPHDDELTEAITALRRPRFVRAPFWQGEGPVDWRLSHLVANFNTPESWVGSDGKHPFAEGAENSIGEKKASEVLRVFRNALAHGNIVYLNKDAQENEGTRVHYMTFLSRYEEGREAQEKAKTYRMIATTEDEFLRFVKAWANWLQHLNRKGNVA